MTTPLNNINQEAFINKVSNWEYILFIKNISNTSRQLLLFVILKDKKWKNNWYSKDIELSAYILPSKNG